MSKKKPETTLQRFEGALRRALATPATAPLVGVKVRAKKKRAKRKRRG